MRKPTAVLETNGAFENHPSRARPNEPQASGIGPAPEHLPDDQKAIWDEIVRNCAAGVFQSSDRVLLEGIVGMVARFRASGDGFGTKSMTLLVSMLARCGMTPADRSRVHVTPPNADTKPKTGLASFRRT